MPLKRYPPWKVKKKQKKKKKKRRRKRKKQTIEKKAKYEDMIEMMIMMVPTGEQVMQGEGTKARVVKTPVDRCNKQGEKARIVNPSKVFIH